jgi:DNA polymerase-3 subunit delta'
MIGHEWARELLRRAAVRGRLGHAYLFAGPPSVGKTALATELAGMLVCSGPEPHPCHTCRACRNLERGVHPDVRLIARDPERRDITIDQVRTLEEEIAMAPYEAPHKLFCLVGADSLNDAASSALLKTLEEPPSHATLVLAAADPANLPITIRSRCQRLTLQPVPANAIADGLIRRHGAQRPQAEELAALARGRPGWAVQALAAPDLLEAERAAFSMVAGLAEAGPFTRLMAVDAWLGKGSFVESRERALNFLSLLEGWWRDALLVALDRLTPGLHRHLVGAGHTPPLAAAQITRFLLHIQETAARVEANVAPRLALEHLIGAMPQPRAGHAAR